MLLVSYLANGYAAQEPDTRYMYPGDGCNVNCVQLVKDGQILLAFDEEKKSLSVRDIGPDGSISYVKLPYVVKGYIGSALKVNHAKKQVAVGQWSTDAVQLVDLETLAIIGSVSRRKGDINSQRIAVLSWSANDNLLCVSPEISSDPMWVVDVRSGDICCEHKSNTMYSASISPRGDDVLIAHTKPVGVIGNISPYKGVVTIFDICNKKERQGFSAADSPCDAMSIEFSKDGFKFAVGAYTNVFLGETSHYNELGKLDDLGFHQMTFDETESLLAVSGENNIRVVKVPSLKTVATLSSGEMTGEQIVWDGDVLAAACSKDNAIKVWDMSQIGRQK